MRGFDPASEDDMDDNGMQRYFDANDDEAWDWYAISFSSEYRETLHEHKQPFRIKDQKKKRPCHKRTARTFLL